jgi:hypothetical protein
MALVTLLLTPWVRAQGDARRELVQRGVAARDAGDHSTALALFEQAGVLEMRPGLRLSIAQEQQVLGRALAACETASQCVAELQASLGSPESARILPACAEVAAVSCRGFARVRIAVPHGLPAGSELRVQGRAVPVTNDEASAFVAAGAVRVELAREGRATLTREIEVTAGAVSTVALGDDPTVNASAGSPPPPPVGGETPRATSVAQTPHPATPHPATPERAPVTSQWWFWTVIALVAVGGTMGGLAAGGVFDRSAAPPAGVNYSVNALQGW